MYLSEVLCTGNYKNVKIHVQFEGALCVIEENTLLTVDLPSMISPCVL